MARIQSLRTLLLLEEVRHREDEMFYVLEGEFEFRCGDRVFKAAKDSLVALPREIPHAFKNTGNALGKTLLVLIPGGTEKAFDASESA